VSNVLKLIHVLDNLISGPRGQQPVTLFEMRLHLTRNHCRFAIFAHDHPKMRVMDKQRLKTIHHVALNLIELST
jgi:hypothetical protein